MEQLATWRRTHGYDRDDSWMHEILPLSPQEFTASVWSDLQELKDAISMSGKARPWQKTRELLDGLKGDLPDEELAVIKRYAESRSRKAAQGTVKPVSTAQHCIPRSLNPEIPSDVYVSMKEKDEGRMNPEPAEIESPSAGTGFETPGQQCSPNEGAWETGRTIADGYFLVGIGSNQVEDISSPTEHVGTRAGTAATPANSSNTIFRRASRKPRDKTAIKENKQFDPGGKGEKPPLWNAAVIGIVFFLSWAELWGMGGSLLVLRVFCLCVSFCLLCLLFYCLR